ncbi:MAG: ABC transporter ATP-binding protein [Clostridiales bacterium]
MNEVLEVENLFKKYKNGRGVENISFKIKEGEVLGLLGPNGSGKTTIMKSITGLLNIGQGKVNICGYDLSENFEKAITQLGCLIEKPVSLEYMTAYNNLKIISRYYEGIDSSRIDEVLESVGLKKYKNEKVKNFSLGMKQRLSIGMAILHKPKLIILDEPANGLDVEGTKELRDIILKLSKEYMISFLISSHLIYEIELICDQILILKEGKIIDRCTVADVIDKGEVLESYFLDKIKTKVD